jgi:hypothetical protein
MNPMNAQFFREHFTHVIVSDRKTEVRGLFDDGATRAQIAAELGINRAIVEALTAPPAPVWPTLPDHLIDRLPPHLQAIARRKP